jgi:methyltransferase
MVALHIAWLLAILLTVPSEAGVSVPLLIVFAILQGLRLWVLLSLGRYWTTRVITVPGAPLVRRGPYRFLRHPNYVVVAAEIAVLPLAFRAWAVATVFSALNAALLAWRISLEDQVLAPRR